MSATRGFGSRAPSCGRRCRRPWLRGLALVFVAVSRGNAREAEECRPFGKRPVTTGKPSRAAGKHAEGTSLAGASEGRQSAHRSRSKRAPADQWPGLCRRPDQDPEFRPSRDQNRRQQSSIPAVDVAPISDEIDQRVDRIARLPAFDLELRVEAHGAAPSALPASHQVRPGHRRRLLHRTGSRFRRCRSPAAHHRQAPAVRRSGDILAISCAAVGGTHRVPGLPRHGRQAR